MTAEELFSAKFVVGGCWINSKFDKLSYLPKIEVIKTERCQFSVWTSGLIFKVEHNLNFIIRELLQVSTHYPYISEDIPLKIPSFPRNLYKIPNVTRQRTLGRSISAVLFLYLLEATILSGSLTYIPAGRLHLQGRWMAADFLSRLNFERGIRQLLWTCVFATTTYVAA